QEVDILLQERFVKTHLVPQLLDRLPARVLAENQQGRVAGDEPHDDEHERDDANECRYRRDYAIQRVLQHPRRLPRTARAARTSGSGPSRRVRTRLQAVCLRPQSPMTSRYLRG